MQYRQLGQTGMLVSEIGFGTWGLGGTAYGPTDDRESLRALRRAFDVGVTFYDTADLYGSGHSETLLGQALAPMRSQIVLATKAGFHGDGTGQDFSPAHLEQALTSSLSRLRTEYVDLFLLHSPTIDTLRADEGIPRTLESSKRRGLARAVGVSVRSPEDGLAVVREFNVDCIEVNFNLSDQRAVENGLLDVCEHTGVGIIVRTPLCFGFLTGAYERTQFAVNDHRGRWSAAQRQRWHEAHEVFRTTGARQTPAQSALRFCLSYPGVSTVIPGMLTCEHVDENTAASDLGALHEDDRQRMEALYRDQSFFVGKP